MSVRFFVDQCVPLSVCESLRQAGYQAEILRDHLPINAKDPEVIAQAQTLDAVLLTYLSEHIEQEQFVGRLFLVEAHRIRIKE